MKKFSKVTGVSVGQEPKQVIKVTNEEDTLKGKVLGLLDDLIKVTTYGPIGRYQSAGSIKITGKELFVEALIELLSGNKLQEEIKLLESLKSNISNWEIIDRKIDEKIQQINSMSEQEVLKPHKGRLKFIYENYKEEELIIQIVESSSKRINDIEILDLRKKACDVLVAEGYPSELFSKIKAKYNSRQEDLRS